LCSSAVLDRLNGLLETNGVLVVGERGCSNEDGTVPTVVPHPDFRLFLTANPQVSNLLISDSAGNVLDKFVSKTTDNF
jgi:midasin